MEVGKFGFENEIIASRFAEMMCESGEILV